MAKVIDTHIENGYLIITKGNQVMTKINIDGDDEQGRIVWRMLVTLLPDGYSMPEPLHDGLKYVVYYLGENKVTCLDDFEKLPDSMTAFEILLEVFQQWKVLKSRSKLSTYNKFPTKNI